MKDKRNRHDAVRLWNNIFVNLPPLPLLCEISGALHLHNTTKSYSRQTKFSEFQKLYNLLQIEIFDFSLHLTIVQHHFSYVYSARNSSWPLAIFRPISPFGRPKSILVSQIYCTFSMGQQSITYKMSDFQENGRPIFDPYFYHCVY